MNATVNADFLDLTFRPVTRGKKQKERKVGQLVPFRQTCRGVNNIVSILTEWHSELRGTRGLYRSGCFVNPHHVDPGHKRIRSTAVAGG